MLFWEHYQSTPDRFGNYQLEPYRFGYSLTLNERWKVRFFRRAERYMRQGPFIKLSCEVGRHGLREWTFQSRVNGYKFKLVGRHEEFILLQVDRREFNDCSWDTPVIRNYFGFLAFMSRESGAGCSAELMGFDC